MFPSASAAADDQIGPGSLGYKEPYTVNEIDLLAEGDILLLYTDGLSEHAGGKCFPTAVESWLRQLADRSASEICRILAGEILAQAPAEDDISFVVVKKTAV